MANSMTLVAEKQSLPLPGFDDLVDRCLARADQTDLSWLRQSNTQWAMSCDALRFIAALALERRPVSILEFGPGQSTHVLVHVCRELSTATRITSIEHDPEYHRLLSQKLARDDATELVQCI